ncbi:hypothetical protein DQ04_04571060 [Trypanosoma grayi]|uniref:hypothetical protein n=1 Tax=Trypanosoma grayi TaxID=71804 RepID=UPI0004F4A450|nr:hypothetical protein DQ04_04571060 [Trypanosoma grayi]KEG09830.1 hypothetical protein DQ04_04571060 [Trypanosoma grayi]
MWNDKWKMCKKALSILWTVGGRLRTVYNGSKSEEDRRKDSRATLLRLAVFVAAFTAFVAVDRCGDATVALKGAAQGTRRLLLWRRG